MSGILKYDDTLWIDFMSITDWTCVADGTPMNIGIELRTGRADYLLANMPDSITPPDDTIEQHRYQSGNLFITTEDNQCIWIKATDPNWPVTVSGEIIYNIDPNALSQPLSAIPAITQGLPWRLG